MREIVADIQIDAEPTAIWSILTDFASYPEWNPFVRRAAGIPAAGNRLTIEVKPPNHRAVTDRPLVTECVENRLLRWQGGVPVPGPFSGEYCLRLEALSPGRTRFTHSGSFSGVLVLLFKRFLNGPLRAGFIEMNQALKSRVEHG